jgi:hypothetical protein
MTFALFSFWYPRKRHRFVAESFQSGANAQRLARRGKKRVRSSFFNVETQVSSGAILNEQTPTKHGISTTRACLEPRAHDKATMQLPHAPFHL